MKTSLYTFLILICVVFCGCHKTNKTKFKGRVVGDINSEPVKNATIYFHQNYDVGSSQSNQLGTYSTDANGNYEFVCEITHYTYELFIFEITDPSGRYSNPEASFPNTDGDFQLITLVSNCDIDFHIVNANPVDSNDLFRRINYSSDTTNHYSNEDLNLHGMNVNTNHLDSLYGNNRLYYYNYDYRKGGIEFSSAYKPITLSGLSTTNVNINY